MYEKYFTIIVQNINFMKQKQTWKDLKLSQKSYYFYTG